LLYSFLVWLVLFYFVFQLQVPYANTQVVGIHTDGLLVKQCLSPIQVHVFFPIPMFRIKLGVEWLGGGYDSLVMCENVYIYILIIKMVHKFRF